MIWGICLCTTYELQFDFNEPSVFLFVPMPCTPPVERGKHSTYSTVLKLPLLKGYYLVKVGSSPGTATFLLRAMGFP